MTINEDFEKYENEFKVWSVCIHSLMAVTIAIYKWAFWPRITMVLLVVSVIGQVFLAIASMQLIEISRQYMGHFTDEFRTFFVWLIVEALVLISALIANFVFLFTRSMKHQMMQNNLEKTVLHTESDFLASR